MVQVQSTAAYSLCALYLAVYDTEFIWLEQKKEDTRRCARRRNIFFSFFSVKRQYNTVNMFCSLDLRYSLSITMQLMAPFNWVFLCVFLQLDNFPSSMYVMLWQTVCHIVFSLNVSIQCSACISMWKVDILFIRGWGFNSKYFCFKKYSKNEK